MPHDDTIFLKSNVDILSFFNVDQLRRVTPDIEHNSYKDAQLILFKGAITEGFYIIKKGSVKVQGKGTGPALLKAGDFFGEMSLLEDIANMESIRAAEDGTEILTIPHASFEKLLGMQPLLKKALLDKIAARKKTQ